MSWARTRLKYLCVDSGQYGLNVSADRYVDRGTRLIRTTDISSGVLQSDENGVYVDTHVEEKYRLRRGDLLLSRSGTPPGQSYFVHATQNEATYAGYLIRFRPRPGVDARFVAYLAQSAPFQQTIYAESVSSTIQNFNAERYANIAVATPDLEEQRRIADLLDAETTRIDSLKRMRERQSDVLELSESSVISEYLESSEAKPVRVKHLTTRITSGPRGWGELVAEEGSLFLRITNIPRRGITLDLDEPLYVAAPAGQERERSRTRVGDILVSITADIGSVAVVDSRGADGNISQHVALIRPDADVCDPTWLAYAIKSARSSQSLRMSSYGGTKVGLGLADVANLSLLTPSLEKQRRLASEISNALTRREELHRRLTKQRALLHERRQALITAAVTGQIDVSTASGRGIED